MDIHTVRSPEELVSLVRKMGFLPFFSCGIHGFSLEEYTPSELWFADGVDGPWEWKGPVVSEGRIAYGKFFHGRAGFISEDWYADFANMRRDGMTFEEAYEDGRIPHDEKLVYDTLRRRGSALSRNLKSASGFGRNGRKGFDSIITRLQMQGYMVTEDFEYEHDKTGRPYGWGIARYATPEALYGDDFMYRTDGRTPEESRKMIMAHLQALLPDADANKLTRRIVR